MIRHLLLRALRSATRSKRLSFAVILTLGLGIGFVTVVFNLINGYLWRPLPYPASDRWVAVLASAPGQSWRQREAPAALLPELRADVAAFDIVAGVHSPSALNLSLSDDVWHVSAAEVSDDWFRLLGMSPVIGRVFAADDFVPGAEPVVVLGHDLWRSAFDSDPAVSGRSVRLDGVVATIIGVMPHDIELDREQLWRPLRAETDAVRIMARLRDDVSFPVAAAQVNAFAASRPLPDGTARVLVLSNDPMGRAPAGVVIALFGLFIGATLLVVLIAASNVTNLLLAAGESRRGKRAVRLALGASRRRIFGESLLESLVLGLAAGVVGLIVALWGTDVLVAVVPNGMPRWIRFGLDLRVLIFAAAIAMVAAVIVGWVPARAATRAEIAVLLRSGGTVGASSHDMRGRRALIAGELALSLALVTSTLVAWRSAIRMSRIDAGYDAAAVLQVGVALAADTYGTPVRQLAFYRAAADRALRLPGVAATSVRGDFRRLVADARTDSVVRRLHVEGRDAAPLPRAAGVDIDVVDAAYLSVTGLPLVRGRFLDARDVAGAQTAAVLSQRLAYELWPGENPIGRDVRIDSASTGWARVVGVVGDRIAIRGGPATMQPERRLAVYFAHAQAVASRPILLVRAAGEPGTLVPPLRGAIRAIDPDQPITRAESMFEADFGAARLALNVFGATMGIIAACGVVLSIIGLYGLISHMTISRTREIGLRAALGASAASQAWSIVREALLISGAGVGLGLVLTFVLTRLGRNMLFGFALAGFDPVAWLAAALLFGLVTILAAYLPARRAMAVDPIVALRAL